MIINIIHSKCTIPGCPLPGRWYPIASAPTASKHIAVVDCRSFMYCKPHRDEIASNDIIDRLKAAAFDMDWAKATVEWNPVE